MENLHRAMAFGATVLDLLFGWLAATSNTQCQREKIDLCGYHRSDYFARLVPEIGLFSKVCNRS